MSLPSYAMNQPSFPEMYERHLAAPLFRPWAEILLNELRLSLGDRLLDIACGTGVVARLAQERLGTTEGIVGVDVSPGMLAVAQAVAPEIDWREGNAADLPLREGEIFDVVTCQQGLQFFPDKAPAVAEMRRALRPGGRLGIATWRPLEENVLFHEMHRIGEQHLGPFVDNRHSFGEAAPLEALLRDAGFTQVRVHTISQPVHFEDRQTIARMNAMALVGMSPASKEMSEEQRASTVAAILRDSEPVIERFTDASGVTFEMRSNVATARA